MIACARNPHAAELDIAQRLRQAAPHAFGPRPGRRSLTLIWVNENNDISDMMVSHARKSVVDVIFYFKIL